LIRLCKRNHKFQPRSFVRVPKETISRHDETISRELENIRETTSRIMSAMTACEARKSLAQGIDAMKVRRGDRVRLVASLAERMMKSPKDKRFKVDWVARRGIVVRVSAPTDTATIKWDDRVTIDAWPMRALEKDTSQRSP
jgi:hypothetical protein